MNYRAEVGEGGMDSILWKLSCLTDVCACKGVNPSYTQKISQNILPLICLSKQAFNHRSHKMFASYGRAPVTLHLIIEKRFKLIFNLNDPHSK